MITFTTAILMLVLLFCVAYLIFAKQWNDKVEMTLKPVNKLPSPLQLAIAHNTRPMVRIRGQP